MTERTKLKAWLRPGYGELQSAKRVGDDLEIEFANGDVVRVSPTMFGVGEDFEVRFDEKESPALQLVTPTAVTELSWSQIRSATDPDFAQEMRRQDAEESRRLGRRLRALREDRGLSQRDLAGHVGMTGPQLSKIESGTFDLRVSTVHTLLRAMNASFADIAGPDALEVSQASLRRSAEKAGVPRDLFDRVLARTPRRRLAGVLAHAFGWDLRAVDLGMHTRADLGLEVRFKSAKAADVAERSPLLYLAVACSQLVHRNAEMAAYRGLPPTASEIRHAASGPEGRITLQSLTEWAWSRGVAVIPVNGRGAFCAAVWTIDNVPIIVVKDSRSHAVFWLFDLAHELGHIAHGHVSTEGIIDVDPLRPDSELPDAQESLANAFALELLLGNHRELVNAVRRESRGNYLRFKTAVATTAKRANVNAGLLGMVAAHELTDVGDPKDRWGSATNLAAPDGDGRPQVERLLQQRLSTKRLSEEDALLLSTGTSSA